MTLPLRDRQKRGGPFDDNALDIAWIGHATVDIRMGSVRMVTDPVLRDRVVHLIRRDGTGRLDTASIDVALLSHLHHDHLDLPSLRRLSRDTVVVTPRGSARLVRRAVAGAVVEVSEGDQLRIGAVRITAVPAMHSPGRTLRRMRATPVGYLLEDGHHTVYFAGDTDLHPVMFELPAPDVALLPIWGWGPKLGPGHLDPERAAEAARILRARVVLPVHWGTFSPVGVHREPPGWLTHPAVEFATAMARTAPDVDLRIVAPGTIATRFGAVATTLIQEEP